MSGKDEDEESQLNWSGRMTLLQAVRMHVITPVKMTPEMAAFPPNFDTAASGHIGSRVLSISD